MLLAGELCAVSAFGQPNLFSAILVKSNCTFHAPARPITEEGAGVTFSCRNKDREKEQQGWKKREMGAQDQVFLLFAVVRCFVHTGAQRPKEIWRFGNNVFI